jgi:hypothetical protein
MAEKGKVPLKLMGDLGSELLVLGILCFIFAAVAFLTGESVVVFFDIFSVVGLISFAAGLTVKIKNWRKKK